MSDVALRFGATDDGLTAKFRQVNKQLDDFEKSANKTAGLVSSGFKALGGIIGSVSLVRLTNELFDYAESLEVASARTGIAVENLQRLQFVASQSDVAVDAVTSAINRMQKELVAGGKESAEAIRGLGLSVEELRNLSPDDQFLKIAAAIAEIPDPAERSAAAMQIFGRGGAELLPILTRGADGVRELSAKFDELGVSVSTETVGKVDDAGDAVGRMGLALKGVGLELLSLAATPIIAIADGFTTLVKAIRYGLTGGDEAEKLNNQILELQGRVSLFEKDRSDSGRERLKQAREELEILEKRQQIELGLGAAGIQPRLQTFGPPDLPMPKGNFGIEIGPSEPTAADRRAEAEKGRAEVDVKIDENTLLEDLNQKHLDELLRQTTDYVTEKVRIESDAEQFLADVRETFGLQQIDFEQIKSQSIFDIASGLFQGLADKNSKFAKAQQAIALAQAIWYTASGIANALRSVPYPLNIAAAAKVALVGAIQIAKIKATNYSGSGGGGSAPSVGGGDSISGRDTAGADQATDERGASPRPQANITIYSTGWSREAIQTFVEAARETFDEYDVTLFGPNSLQAQIIRET